MVTAVITPRQLAPTVGRPHAGFTISTAPASAIYDLSTSWGTISFGALSFAKHLPVLHPVFNALCKGVDLVLGSFRFHVTQSGTIRLPDPICLHEMMSVPCVKNVPRHFVGMVLSESILPAIDYESDDCSIGSSNSNVHPRRLTEHVCMAGPTDPTNVNNDGTAAVDAAAATSNNPVDVNVSDIVPDRAYEEAIARARQAWRDNVDIMTIPREDLPAYQYVFDEEWRNPKQKCHEADQSEQRRVESEQRRKRAQVHRGEGSSNQSSLPPNPRAPELHPRKSTNGRSR